MIHFIDIETTGLDPYRHEMIEFGMVSAEKGRKVSELEFSLPFDVDAADPGALDVNGWGRREFAPEVTVKQATRYLWSAITNKHLVSAWHAHFDFAFLGEFWRRAMEELEFAPRRRPPWSHRGVVDLPSLVMGRMGVLTAGSTKDLMSQLGIEDEFEGKHTALADAEANFRVYQELKLYEVIP